MESKRLKLKRKKMVYGDTKAKLPLKYKKEMVGVFNGLNVVIHDWSSMKYLYEEGCFGKGSLSKREPDYHAKKDDVPKLIFEQQMKNQSVWNCSLEYVCPQKYLAPWRGFELSTLSVQKFLESSFDSYDEKHEECSAEQPGSENNSKWEQSFLENHPAGKPNDDKFKGLVYEILESRQSRKPTTPSFKHKSEVIILSPRSNMTLPTVDAIDARLEHDFFLPEENLNLNWEESLYLKSVLGCLTIIDSDKKNLTSSELWEKFKAADQNFMGRYVTYHYFRSKGWIVRSGIKFGGDYVLYKIGPAHYHSNYLVKVLDEKKISWRELIVNNRLAETFNKDVVFVKVSPYQLGSDSTAFPELLENYTVEVTLVSRWFPSRERQSKDMMH